MPVDATAQYPASLATIADLLNWHNTTPSVASPQLATGITDSDTTITVRSGTGVRLPVDNFTVSIDDEIIFVALRTDDSLTGCVRAFEVSVNVSHNLDAAVEARVTARSHNQVVAELLAIQAALGVHLRNVSGTTVRVSAISTSLSETDAILLATGGSGGITVTLPTAVGKAGRKFTIKKVDAGAGNISIVTTSAQTIDGQSNWLLVDQFQFLEAVSDGAAWNVIGGN